jgi:hypothetical protein
LLAGSAPNHKAEQSKKMPLARLTALLCYFSDRLVNKDVDMNADLDLFIYAVA